MRTLTIVVYVEDSEADAMAAKMETIAMDLECEAGVVATEYSDEETDAEDEGYVRNNAEYKD